MRCRIGITTDPTKREAYWRGRVNGFQNWKHLAEDPTQKEAEAAEAQLAILHGCESAPGGSNAPGPWFVYYFEFTSDPGD